MKRSLVASLFCLVFCLPHTASAHLATFGSWEITQKYLTQLFPDADGFRVKNDSYTESEVAMLEKQLGFKLYPEDKNPTFYLAVKGKKFLGAAIFIDPRLDGTSDFVRLEVGIAVDRTGQIANVKLFEYRGDRALNDSQFLKQFVGLKLNSVFDLDKNKKLSKANGLPAESQLVANAAREALLLIKTSLARK